jgi:hypothetical protein
MPTDEVAPAELRQASERRAADNKRRLAAEIVAMLPEARDEARRVLEYRRDLNLPVGE